MTYRDVVMKAARKHARLAFTYADDGAFATAAKLLRETAELFDAEQHRMGRLMMDAAEKRSKP